MCPRSHACLQFVVQIQQNILAIDKYQQQEISQFGLKGLLLLHVHFHLPLEYFVSLLETGLENLHELVQLLPGVLRHEVDPESGLAHLHHRVLDPVDVHARVHHQPRNESAHDLVAHEQRQDGARVPEDLVASGLQFLPEVVIVLHDFLAELAAVLGAQDAELGEGGGSLDGVDSVGEHVGRGVVLQVFNNFSVIAAHKANVGAQTFASGSNQEHIGQVGQFLDLPIATAIVAHAAEIMGAVDQQVGSVLLADFLSLDEVGRVGIHGEQALGDNQNRTFWVLLSSLLQCLHHGIVVEVGELEHIGSGSVGALLQAVMGKLIHDHIVVLFDHSLDDAEAGQPTRGVNQQGFDAPEVSELVLQLYIVSTQFKILSGSECQGAAGGVNSELLGDSDGGFDGEVVPGQAQVIGRGEVDAVEDVVVVIHSQDLGGGGRQQAPVVQPHLLVPLALYVVDGGVDALEHVRALGLGPQGDVLGLEDVFDVDGPLEHAGLGVDFAAGHFPCLNQIRQWLTFGINTKKQVYQKRSPNPGANKIASLRPTLLQKQLADCKHDQLLRGYPKKLLFSHIEA